MANHGFGFGGMGPDASGSNDFDAMARQYWNAWGEMMRAGKAPAQQPAMPGWDEAIGWWSQLAKGAPGVAGASAGSHAGVNDALDRFNTQARGWYAQMQQLAAQFAGQDAGAADIAGAWKQAMGGQGGNPFAEMFSHMQGPGQHGVGQWFEQARPYLQGLEAWQRGGQSWQGTPAFGFAREHQERWQQLAQAQADYQEKAQAYNALMGEAGQRAFEVFETKLAERSEPGRQLTSARALFDLWIDAAEDAYAEIALSPRFREVYGDLVNSQMRLRAGVQREVEQASGVLGMPTRTEIDSAHRKIVQLERELRRLRDAMSEQVTAKPAPKPVATEQADVARPGVIRRVTKRDAAQREAKPAGKSQAAAQAVKKSAAPAPKRGAVSKATVASKAKGKR